MFDTNVFVSAYGFGGKPADALRLAIFGEVRLLVSPALLAELSSVLRRVLGYDDRHVEAVLRQIVRLADVVRPTANLRVFSDDPDNRVLECAIDGSAEMIVSGDRHLLDLGEFQGIRVMTVSELLHS